MAINDADGYFIFKRVSKTSGTDGSGYVELEYAGHTYGRTPDEYVESFMARSYNKGRDKTLIFFKISDAHIHDFSVRTIPETYELVGHDKKETPITDLRWMT